MNDQAITDHEPDGSGLRLVIADDDEDIRNLLRINLELNHYEIVGVAVNGEEAVAQAIAQHPDVIILDYRMPELDGAQAAEQIRGAAPDVKIVGFSATHGSENEWADTYIEKWRIAELSSLIEKLCRNFV